MAGFIDNSSQTMKKKPSSIAGPTGMTATGGAIIPGGNFGDRWYKLGQAIRDPIGAAKDRFLHPISNAFKSFNQGLHGASGMSGAGAGGATGGAGGAADASALDPGAEMAAGSGAVDAGAAADFGGELGAGAADAAGAAGAADAAAGAGAAGGAGAAAGAF